MSYDEEKDSFIIDHESPFVSQSFLSYMQPFFYHKELTIEETISEWQNFGDIYQNVKSLSEDNVVFTVEMEKELDNYYKDHPKLSQLYFDKKVELNIRNQQTGAEQPKEPLILKDFQMPDREFFEKAKAICEYTSLNSLRMTYAGYNNFPEKEQTNGIEKTLVEFYSFLRKSITEALVKNDIGLGVLNINIIDSPHFNLKTQTPRGGSFISSLNSIEINHINEYKMMSADIFLHEYTHFLEERYYSVFQSDMIKSGKESLLYKNIDYYRINDTLNELTDYDFFFSSFNGTGKNNKLYQIFNATFFEQHADFIRDYDESIYLNITGQNLNRTEMRQDLLSRNYKSLFEPVSKLIENDMLQNTTADNFINQNEDFLNDFISSLRYHIFNIDDLLNNHDNYFTKFISLHKYMKYKLDPTYINPEINEEKFLHSLFIAMIEVDRQIGEKLDAEGSSASTPLYERVHDYYPTVDLFIPEENFRKEALYILVEGHRRKLDVNYFTLPCELLAYSMTNDYDKKPQYIKEANQKFYNKYINYIAEKLPFEIRSFDKDIINNLNILSEKQLLTDNVQTIQPAKVVAPSI